MNSFNKYIKRNVMYKLGTMILSFLLVSSCIPVYAQEYEDEETTEEVIQEEYIEPEEVIDNTEEYEEVIEEEIPEESGEIILEGSPPVAPENGTTVNNPFPYGTAGSHSFRIPSLTTLSDGSLFAAADIRYNTTYNGGGLDTIVARSSDGGSNWSYSIANYLGD
ncbi:MAG: exo-alpha-sialidase, partial [Erysipelotrichaceae bacterium]|nr:exo-alpha-sialidase [Erysipelotrichaceae bacterium]